MYQHKILPYIDSVAVFSEVADDLWSVFLDSGGYKKGFDILAVQPEQCLLTKGEVTEIVENGVTSKSYDDPIKLLKESLPKSVKHSLSIPYVPGALGYFSYDLARRFESWEETAENDECLPEMAIGIYSVVVVVDHAKQQTWLIRYGQDQQTDELWQFWLDKLGKVVEKQEEGEALKLSAVSENMNQQQYFANFDKVQHYITEGDCYQVNLAKRFSGEAEGDAWQTYVHLRQLSPAPYAAYMNYPFATVLSNSPESFISCRDGKVVTSPIKGTRPRDHSNKGRDQEIARELYESEKDRAENLMIVDLMRNDLGKCCKPGSINVPSLFALHSFANVHHLISTIEGELDDDIHSLDLLRHCFPGGSITGAPKLRAMQIIEELEPHRRGLYCGSIGYIGFDGDMETNIAIRTITFKDGVTRYSAGGGLVADSDKQDEYQEILDKAKMMTAVLVEDE